jgi:hypothetical protein
MTPQQTGQRRQADLDRLIQRLASDPTYRQELLAHPAVALAAAGLVDEPLVSGYRPTGCGPKATSCPPRITCTALTAYTTITSGV